MPSYGRLILFGLENVDHFALRSCVMHRVSAESRRSERQTRVLETCSVWVAPTASCRMKPRSSPSFFDLIPCFLRQRRNSPRMNIPAAAWVRAWLVKEVRGCSIVIGSVDDDHPPFTPSLSEHSPIAPPNSNGAHQTHNVRYARRPFSLMFVNDGDTMFIFPSLFAS
jgi:hypothetical protein